MMEITFQAEKLEVITPKELMKEFQRKFSNVLPLCFDPGRKRDDLLHFSIS